LLRRSDAADAFVGESMAAERNQHRVSSIVIRLVTGVSTFVLAVILSTHYNPLGPNISPADLASQNPIVVAKIEIPIGSRILAEQLQVVQMPRSVVPAGAFTRIDDTIIGRVVVTRIGPREPITESRLAPVGSTAGLSSVIPEGYRAMTIRVDDVVGFIMPGALVDVVIVIEPSAESHNERISKIVLQNVKVLAQGTNLDQSKNELERVKNVTLQLTPEQAEKLAIASSEGKLQLVMRK
jgi:pilus assembly protein CpaB